MKVILTPAYVKLRCIPRYNINYIRAGSPDFAHVEIEGFCDAKPALGKGGVDGGFGTGGVPMQMILADQAGLATHEYWREAKFDFIRAAGSGRHRQFSAQSTQFTPE